MRTIDGGGYWVAANYGNLGAISAIEVDPQNFGTLYVGTYGDGVYRSMNFGETWVSINKGLDSYYIYSLAIDPEAPNRLYAGTEGDGIFLVEQGPELYLPLVSR